MTETKGSRGFTRRSFIKGVAAVTAAGALAGCTPKEDDKQQVDPTPVESPDQIFAGACRGNCGGGCFLNIHVRDNQVVRTTARDMPDPRYNRICPKGLAHVGRMYSSSRILYPMKRVGERGSNDFERISWDEAIETIATKWKEITDQYGYEAIGFLWGTGNHALCGGASDYLGAYQRFINVMGFSVFYLDVDQGFSYGSGRAGGGSATSLLTDRENAKTIVVWCHNPVISQPQAVHFYLEAKGKGTKYIVIDPVYNASSAKADWWIPVKAGTDGALALGVLNVLFSEGWIDDDLLRFKTEAACLIKEDGRFLRMSDLGVDPIEGPADPYTGEPTYTDPYAVWDEEAGAAVAIDDAVRPALEGVGEVSGFKVQTAYENAMERIGEYAPERASEICGVSADDIRELARVYYEEGPVSTEMAMGANHYYNAHYGGWPFALIPRLTGNVGKPGASFGNGQSFGPQFAFSNFGACYPTDSAGNPCRMSGRTMVSNRIEEIIDTGQYAGQEMILKGLYVHSTNAVVTLANHDHSTSFMNKLDFVVVADMCMTETAKYADIVLPVCHWFEQTDVAYLYFTHPYIMWQDKAVEPLGESKSDFQIFKLLCEAMGLGEYWAITEEDFIKQVIDTDGFKAMGVTFDGLKQDKIARIFAEGDCVPSEEEAYSSRLRLYNEADIVPQYFAGQEIDESKERSLYWEEPKYCGENSEYRKTYPYHLLSDHMRTRTHSQWWECGYMKDYEPEPIVRINPLDAEELGIQEGDVVKLSNDQGYVVMKAVIHGGLPRKMVSSPRSFQAEEFIEGHYASLPHNDYNPLTANHNYNDCAVMIEKM